MKRNAIARIIIYSLLLLVLLGLFLSAMGVHLYSFDRKSSSHSTTTPIGDTDLFRAEDIRSIQIDWAAGQIDVVYDDVSEIQVSYSLLNDRQPKIRQSSSKLEISYPDKVSFGKAIKGDNLLTICLPLTQKLDSLEIDAAATDIFVLGADIQDVDLDIASGKLEFDSCHVGKLDLDSAAGELIYSGTLNELDVDGASTNCRVSVTNTPKSISMDAMSGKLELTLPEDAGFRVERDSLGGSFTSDFPTKKQGDAQVYGNGECRIQVDGLSASVAIYKMA